MGIRIWEVEHLLHVVQLKPAHVAVDAPPLRGWVAHFEAFSSQLGPQFAGRNEHRVAPHLDTQASSPHPAEPLIGGIALE